ncbi:exodeoxyribonuclease X [Salmonella enterica subsp. enterica]|uniref:Exodeoxyribonuclease X n=1 Tax=Salmonella enterica I TaxID=59201 RepID=A0A379UQX3_SALET|nr:exodeoxyribonuclease X [Salmonella enterica subsp. enterica]
MLRIIDTETCGLQGGIVEIASVDVIDGNIGQSHESPDTPRSPYYAAGDGDTPYYRSHGRR